MFPVLSLLIEKRSIPLIKERKIYRIEFKISVTTGFESLVVATELFFLVIVVHNFLCDIVKRNPTFDWHENNFKDTAWHTKTDKFQLVLILLIFYAESAWKKPSFNIAHRCFNFKPFFSILLRITLEQMYIKIQIVAETFILYYL